jgi:glycosyltransferase involved in cell wall biosynthesis
LARRNFFVRQAVGGNPTARFRSRWQTTRGGFGYFLKVTPALTLQLREQAANFLSLLPEVIARPTPAIDRLRQAQPNNLAPISATILTKNSEALLAQVLAALAWCEEVVVLDTGSTDRTLTIAASFANVSVHRWAGPFPGFGRAHRHAVALARHDWILSIDSDEIVSPELAAEIATLPLSDTKIVYTIPFQNFYAGKHITSCGWAPDRHERLFNRTATNFCASEVHERVQTPGLEVVQLRQPIAHYSYRSTDDFLRKMNAYSHLFAEQNLGRKSPGAITAVSRSAWAFFKSYVLQRGFLQGAEGLTISAYKSQVVFWKYLMLREANRRAAA